MGDATLDPARGDGGAGALGMRWFIASLSMLFAATMIGFAIMMVLMRGRREAYDPDTGGVRDIEPMPDLPPLPAILWASTLIILLSSATIQWAKVAADRASVAGMRVGLLLTLALGVAFLILQMIAWLDWNAAVEAAIEHDAYRFGKVSFYVLSIVHAAHLVGGLLPMAFITARAMARKGSARVASGIRHLALYWHFLDVIWIIMFTLMMILL
jgi:cytochrome c oxidase subunit 3